MYIVCQAEHCEYCITDVDVVQYICSIFGWVFSDVFEILLDLINSKSVIRDENLGLVIQNIGKVKF